MTPEISYAELAGAFDAIAADYDALYGPEGNRVMRRMRRENLSILRLSFPPRAHLLEIGCGTGEEAIQLAGQGYTVQATDISPRMVEIARSKGKEAGLSSQLSFSTRPAAGLADISPPATFDGAYASFGSLNCEPDLPAVAAVLGSLLKPGARFVCSVMNRLCPFETAWFMAHLQPRTALRRWRGGWQRANVNGKDKAQVPVPMRYLSAGILARIFRGNFTVEKQVSLGLFLPPPYLDHLLDGNSSFWDRAIALERRIRGVWPMREMGDHVVLVMRNRKQMRH